MRTLSVRQILASLALAIFSIPVLASDARLPFPDGGILVLSAPDGWRYAGQSARTPTMAFTPISGNAFMVVVSTFPPGVGPSSLAAVRKLVEAGVAGARSQATEQTLPIKDIRASGIQGHYFSATDKAPKPGEFQYMTQGAMLVRGQPVAFTILSNGDPNAATEPALRMLGNAKRE